MFIKACSWSLTSEQVYLAEKQGHSESCSRAKKEKYYGKRTCCSYMEWKEGGHAARSVTFPVSRAFSGGAWARAATAPVSVPRNLCRELPLERTKDTSL